MELAAEGMEFDEKVRVLPKEILLAKFLSMLAKKEFAVLTQSRGSPNG